MNGTQMPDFSKVRLIAMDVDGVLTNGSICMNASGETEMVFIAADGLGIAVAIHEGIEIAWITGRDSLALRKRASALGVKHLFTGVRDKRRCLTELMHRLHVTAVQTAYVGDDWNDLPAFEVSGICCAPSNARPEVCIRAHVVTNLAGGSGAVREIIDSVFREAGILDEVCARYVASLTSANSERSSAQ